MVCLMLCEVEGLGSRATAGADVVHASDSSGHSLSSTSWAAKGATPPGHVQHCSAVTLLRRGPVLNWCAAWRSALTKACADLAKIQVLSGSESLLSMLASKPAACRAQAAHSAGCVCSWRGRLTVAALEPLAVGGSSGCAMFGGAAVPQAPPNFCCEQQGTLVPRPRA